MGLTVFFLDFFKDKTHWNLGFMQASGILCLICLIMISLISALTKNTNTEENLKLVWDSPLTPFKIPGARGILNYKFLSVVVLIAVCTIYYIFRMQPESKVQEWAAAHPQNAAKILAHTKKPIIAQPQDDSDADTKKEEK